MAESDDQQPQQPAQQPQPEIRILNQFVRDLSFENVAAQNRMEAQVKPEIKVSVNLDVQPRGEDRYEVSLKLNATSTAEDKTLFVAELDYAGIFIIRNVPQEQLHPFLLIECPRQLFPFARRIMADCTRDGGYAPLMLDVIDFVEMYRQNLQRRQAEQQAQNQQPVGNA